MTQRAELSRDEGSFGSVIAAFAEIARSAPDTIAIEAPSGRLTYAELDRRAGALAAHLIELGLDRAARVAICLDPDLFTAIAILGVLKAGLTYVPVSPGDPVGRVAALVADSAARVILTDATRRVRFDGLAPHVIAVEDGFGQGAEALPDRSAAPDDIAYVLYTSGSSGQPKGVLVPHSALAYYLSWHITCQRRDMGGTDLPLTSSICFAAGVTQFYAPLLTGGTLHILPADTIRQPTALFAFYEGHPELGLYCVPTLWNELLRHAEAESANGASVTPPRVVLLSGESVDASLVRRSFAQWPGLRMWNLYGPTEATANASVAELRPDAPVTIGAPLPGTAIFLVDEHMREVGAGEEGELCICGDGVASGYVGRPDLTAERFVPSPFAVLNGHRMFRTGDLARRDAEGRLVYAGRKDFQIKIRGHRVEIGEITAALLAHPVLEAAEIVYRDAGERRLVAYLQFRTGEAVPVNELRAFLADRLPDYMIPEAFVTLAHFPKLANGKVNRRALPAPGRDRPDLATPYVAPADALQRDLVRVFEDVLGIDGIGIRDDIFDLGATSLRIAAALARMRHALGLTVSYRDVFEHPTVSGLATRVTSAGDAAQPMPAVAGETVCADNQASLFLLDQTFDRLVAYNMQFSLRFDGTLDLRRLETALTRLLERHKVLRARFAEGGQGPVMRFGAAPDVALVPVDVAGSDERDNLKRAEREKPFDLGAGPLIRFALCRETDKSHCLTVTVHHIVFDGRSISAFAEQLVEEYRRLGANAAAVPVDTGPDYADWVAHQAHYHDGAEGAAALAHWRDALAGSPKLLRFPTDHPRPTLRRFNGAAGTLRFDADLVARLGAFGREHGATPFMVLLAGFNLLLYRFSGQDDIVVGTPVANRDRPETETLIGYFTNAVALRTRLDADQTFAKLLADVRRSALDMLGHQAFSFERLVAALQPERSLAHAPLFQVMFAYHERLFVGAVDPDLHLKVSEDGNPGAKFDLTLDVQEDSEGLDLKLTYNTDLFVEATITRLLDAFRVLIDAVIADPRRPIAAYPLLDAARSSEIIHDWNATKVARPHPQTLHGLFERQAATTPDRPALVTPGSSLTYAELNGRANRLARHLVAHGTAPGATIGIRMEASPDMIVAILAILKTGAAYVPLDPLYPRERLNYIIADSGIATVVTDGRLDARYGALDLASDGAGPREITLLALDAVGHDIAALADDDDVSVDADPESLAYLIYTSGSTGEPKGVMVPHRGAANYVAWMRDRFPLTANDRVLLRTSINFDISVWEIFLPLISGAQLAVGDADAIQAPDTLAALIADLGVTQIQFVPSALRAFVDAGALAGCSGVKRIFAGGEALSHQLQYDVFSAFEGELHNLYGPTETSIYSCHWQCRRDDIVRAVPIGGPVDNTEVYVLDAGMNPVPEGVTGEIYVGGIGVAHGYRNKPGITARSFVPDPFSGRPGASLFRTGDVALHRGRGIIEFIGRKDTQIKLRGYRIDLSEIEHQLCRHPGVSHAIVIAREDRIDDVRLVAYVLGIEGAAPGAAELRDHLRAVLPGYMVPANFLVLDKIPMLPNNKVNRAALPKPERDKDFGIAMRRHFDSRTEQALAEIWREVLETDRFGPDDSFFDVGGHSLLIAKLRVLIEAKLEISVTNIDLFQFPSIRGLARHLNNKATPATAIAAEMARRAALRKKRARRP